MNRQQYINGITELYKQANLSDSDNAEPWQQVSDSNVHCRALEIILKDLLGAEYDSFFDSL